MDPTYAPVKVYFDENGDRLTIADGGTLRLEAGAITEHGNAVPFIADPTGGTTVDAEARAAIVEILAALAAHGLMASATSTAATARTPAVPPEVTREAPRARRRP